MRHSQERSELRSRIPRSADGLTLLDYLTSRFRYRDREGWLAEIEAQRLLVDGRPITGSTRLRSGRELCYLRASSPEPYVDRSFVVLHEDETLLAVDKPAHLPMHADGPFARSTLVQLVREHTGSAAWGLVHRLDRETSGVVVLAATADARRSLQQQWHAGTVAKTYHAIVRGHVAAPFTVDLPIGRSRDSSISLRRAAGSAAVDPLPACTHFTPEAHGLGVTLLRCEPTTGRTHQIRVHLEAHGTPILGDKLYGRPDHDYLAFVAAVKQNGDGRTAAPGEPDRQLLHASELRLQHPSHGEPLRLLAPMPAAFAAALASS
ncbi:MAG: RluA family pseudouridine synthase [Planctomycetes bacterium]|nr:RluA family pseudouridine synthase [Planctomycetota bacterium]